jgi:UDP-N-acetylglucosamine--N-acetylmuramyl-(pentapeptide) pyrophosphoryl-undecaprenol N-acetylglucosamine transferase
MKLLIAGGGTGGHVFPAVAVAQEWLRRGRDREVVLVGTERGLEQKLVPAAGLPLETIRVAGLKGIGGLRLVGNAARLPLALTDAGKILRRHRVSVALGVGGYASGPMILMARLRGVPAVIFEPNAEPGLANRLLAPLVQRIAVAHPDTATRWKAKAVVTGCPVRREFFEMKRENPNPKFTVLVTGGSQGALPINRCFIAAAERLATRKDELFLVHQTGERDYNAVREAYAQRGIQSEVLPFISNMAERFAQADLIVCRSGAITVAEVAAAGRAAIFIPFAAATDSHQLRNAQVMARAGAARLIPQPELTPERLTAEIFALMADREELHRLGQNARALARPGAAEKIVGLLEELAAPVPAESVASI